MDVKTLVTMVQNGMKQSICVHCGKAAFHKDSYGEPVSIEEVRRIFSEGEDENLPKGVISYEEIVLPGVMPQSGGSGSWGSGSGGGFGKLFEKQNYGIPLNSIYN